jgi:hypothetical protein
VVDTCPRNTRKLGHAALHVATYLLVDALTSERQSRLARKRGHRVGFSCGRVSERLGVRWLVECVRTYQKVSYQPLSGTSNDWPAKCTYAMQA